jgi:hypothetical protein
MTDEDEVGAMNRLAVALSLTIAWSSTSPEMLSGQANPSTAVRACSLLPKEEVKRHVPWEAMFDFMEPEENAIGDSGSSCSYPTVEVQVLPSTSRIIEVARQRGGLEAVSGIGDEAYFYNNADEYAEVLVRAGRYIITVQADADDGIESSKPRAANLARALVAALP